VTVYFITDDAERVVKIGYSAQPSSRIRALQTSTHRDLRLHATIPGEKDDEAAWHRRFDHLHVRGEWFRHEPEIDEAIRQAPNEPKKPAPPQVAPVIREPVWQRRFQELTAGMTDEQREGALVDLIAYRGGLRSTRGYPPRIQRILDELGSLR
jgi:hypothetical protein